MRNKNQNMWVPNSQRKSSKISWLILILWIIIVIGAAIGLSFLANIMNNRQISKLDSYKLDYSDKIVENTNKVELRTFEFIVGNQDNKEESQEIQEYTENSNLTNSRLLVYMETREELINIQPYNSKIPELLYNSLKEQGFENGDIIVIHYDEPDLENKGSQDIEKAVVQYNYIKTVDKLNGTDSILEEDRTVDILISRETYNKREYILNRIRDKIRNNEEYTITIEKIDHVVDYPQNVVKTVTKEY